jgi:putative transposase
MVIQKSFKFRIHPNKKQEKRLEICLDQACFLYNQLLDIHNQIYEGEKRSLTQFDMNKLLIDFETLNLHSQVKQNISKRISDAFNSFFRRVKNKENPGYPKFHKRIFYKSITFPQYRSELYFSRLYVKDIGMIKMIKHREIEGNIKTLIIIKEGFQWFAVFSCNNCLTEDSMKEFKSEVEGLDVGIKKFLSCSDGREFDNHKFLKRSEKKLAKLQKILSKKKKGSKNRLKARIKVNKLHMKIKRQRKDFNMKLARKLSIEIKNIGIEDLNINGMVKNHHLAKNISDCGWYQFFNYLKYYKTFIGGKIIVIGRFEPTSQSCSNCGDRQSINLSIRKFKCKKCNLNIDRDLNASINIKKLSIQKLNNTVGNTEIQDYGLNIRPSSMKAIKNEVVSYQKIV